MSKRYVFAMSLPPSPPSLSRFRHFALRLLLLPLPLMLTCFQSLFCRHCFQRTDARTHVCTHVPIGTPADKCTQTITGTWKPLPGDGNMHMVKAHFHCHAPTCIKVEMWNNDTGKLLCRETTLVGGKGTLPGPKKFDEDGQFKSLFLSLSFSRSLTVSRSHPLCVCTNTYTLSTS